MAMTVVPSDKIKAEMLSCFHEDDGDKIAALIENAADESVKGIRQKTMIELANASLDDGESLFIRAAVQGRANIVRTLIKYGAKINDLRHQYDNATALHLAARRAVTRDKMGDKNFELVKLLLDAGMDPMLKMKDWHNGEVTVSRALSKQKAEVEQEILYPEDAWDYEFDEEAVYDEEEEEEEHKRRQAEFDERYDFERVEKALQKNQEGNVRSLQSMARHVLRMENPSLARELPKHLQSNVTVEVEGYAF